MDNMINVRHYAASICDLFEELLDKHDITIHDDDRTGSEGEARLYGLTYYDLEEKVTNELRSLIERVKANPDAAYEYFNYS